LNIIRRIHLFTGIIMLPWVMMYALSAFTFNHLEWFNSFSLSHSSTISGLQELSKPDPLKNAVPFLMYLHRASTYNHSPGLRWWWAVMVDGMVLTLVFWGISGVVMWWQMKRHRMWGIIALCSCFLVSVLMIAGMWAPWVKDFWEPAQARKRAEALKHPVGNTPLLLQQK
jgi:hypothetical protein